METIDKPLQKEAVRIGFGTKEHLEVLRRAFGCEQCLTVEQVDGMMDLEVPNPLRPDADDVAVFIQPSVMTPAHLKWLASSKGYFEVPGHDPVRLVTWSDRQAFRALKPTAPEAVIPETRGAPREYEVPDDYRDTAVKLWHHGEMVGGKWKATYKPSEIEDKIEADTGVRVKFTWVRDLAKARVGHTRRNPNA